MTIKEAYIYFLDIVEKNSTNNNLNIDKNRFVEWFNLTLKKYQEYALKKRNEDSIREMSPFLKEEVLPSLFNAEDYVLLERPKDFFDFVNLTINAKKDKCKASDFRLHEVKAENIHIYLTDENYKPSFKARESFYHFMDEGVAVYHSKDFDILKAKMKYYKQIPEVQMEGTIDLNGNYITQDIDPTMDDKTVVKVLQKMAIYFSSAEGDVQKFQMEQVNFR